MLQPLRHSSAVLVDRNLFQRKLLRTVLRSSGFTRVNEFDDIELGLDDARRLYPDFLFIDYDTAKGSELLRSQKNIRKSILGANTHVFFLMQHPTRKRVAKAVEFGAHWVISRPFSPKCLNNRLAAILDPTFGVTVPPARSNTQRGGLKIRKHKFEHLENGALTGHMQDLLKQSETFKDHITEPQSPVRTDIRNRIEALEKDLQTRIAAGDEEKSDTNESVMLI